MVLSLLTSGQLSGQIQKQSKTILSGNIKVVIINCVGNCKLNSSSINDIVLKATLTAHGTVYGWKKISTPPLEIITEQHSDTLLISTTPINKVVAIGISTYTETLEMNIALPSSISEISVTCEKVLNVSVVKQNVSSIDCKVSKKLLFNGIEKKKEFEFGGIGKQSFVLKAENINATWK